MYNIGIPNQYKNVGYYYTKQQKAITWSVPGFTNSILYLLVFTVNNDFMTLSSITFMFM